MSKRDRPSALFCVLALMYYILVWPFQLLISALINHALVLIGLKRYPSTGPAVWRSIPWIQELRWQVRNTWRQLRRDVGALLCRVGLHKRGNPSEVSGDTSGMAVGDGPLRLMTSGGEYSGDYYVTKVEANKLVLHTCVRCKRVRP